MLKYNAASMVGKIRDAINKLIVSELEKHGIEGIVPSHGDILVFLYQKNRLSVKEIAEKIHRKQPTVTVLVDKLEKLGYVERIKSEEDSRVTLIDLTEKGKQLEPLFREVSDKVNDSIYGRLNTAEKEQLEHLLERILKGF
ncbi:MarR family winged helix-turn-helix transcriptional regulator [Neobacillus sp. NPDC093182]|uniref:MarR family winged helix-turn-helix transcriptional regulator n=1 Tax=Neobacillus sp. NPDC093182 TaxID=3364297 RepID=UPI003830C9FF